MAEGFSFMASGPAADVTQLLVNWSKGDQASLDQLLPLVYGELRRLASSYLRRERSNHTLQSTALVHEAFMRLVNQQDVQWKNRAHFYAIAAQMIRRILVDYARSQHAEKRGSGAVKLALDEAMAVAQTPATDIDLLGLNDALDQLAALDERQSRIVELRFFAGLSIEETAEVMHLSPATIKREWQTARAWLFRDMTRNAPPE
jgi:RNA polymerase sigma factor (TIGR02999 family)